MEHLSLVIKDHGATSETPEFSLSVEVGLGLWRVAAKVEASGVWFPFWMSFMETCSVLILATCYSFVFFFSFPSSNSKEINRLDQPLAVYRFIKLIYALWSLLVLSLLHFLFHWHVGTLKLIKWCHKLMDLIDRLGWAVSLGKWRGSLFHSCYCSKCWLSMPHVHYVVPSSFKKSVLIFFVTEISLNWKRYGHESLVTNVITRRLTWRKGL